MSFVLIVAIAVTVLLTFYLGKRLQKWFSFKVTGILALIYWLVLLAACSLLIVSRMLSGISTYWLPLLGNLIFGGVICAIYSLFIFDIIHLLSLKRFKPAVKTRILYLICVAGMFTYGYHMATKPAIVHYQVSLSKPAKFDHLRIVQVSDIHISEVTSPQFIQQLVDDVNALDADLLFITGDIIDNRLSAFTNQQFTRQFKQMKSKYGTYAVMGNHEYINLNGENNGEQDIIRAYQAAGMRVLRDDIYYHGKLGVTIVGRDDISAKKFGQERATLDQILSFVNHKTPIIVLDHQPKEIDEAANNGVDLMLSGHTHDGQLFPLNLLVERMYKNSYGMYQDLDSHFTSIVSSGYGLWGPPIRLMTRSEIVVIDVDFQKQEDVFESQSTDAKAIDVNSLEPKQEASEVSNKANTDNVSTETETEIDGAEHKSLEQMTSIEHEDNSNQASRDQINNLENNNPENSGTENNRIENSQGKDNNTNNNQFLNYKSSKPFDLLNKENNGQLLGEHQLPKTK